MSNFPPRNAFNIEAFLSWIKQHDELQTVILINRYSLYIEGYGNENEHRTIKVNYRNQQKELRGAQGYLTGLRDLCLELKNMGKDVIIIEPIPEQGFDILQYASNKHYPFKISLDLTPYIISYESYMKRNSKIFTFLHELEKHDLATIIPVASFFFASPEKSRIMLDEKTHLYFDDDHLSDQGADALLQHIERTFNFPAHFGSLNDAPSGARE